MPKQKKQECPKANILELKPELERMNQDAIRDKSLDYEVPAQDDLAEDCRSEHIMRIAKS